MIEQVMVGKMSQANGQLSLFTLPQNFVWLKFLSAEEFAEFLVELFNALTQSQRHDNWNGVMETIEAWQETANLKADPLVQQGIEQGLTELKEGQYVSWQDLRAELKL